MTQSDAKPGVDNQVTLHSVLRAVAENPTGQDTIHHILSGILELTFADAGFFLVFDEADILVSQNLQFENLAIPDLISSIKPYVDELYVGIDVPDIIRGEFRGWMVIPVEHDSNAVGALVMLYSNTAELQDSLSPTLESMVNILQTVTLIARTQARQIRHNRNRQEFLRIVTHDMRSPLTSMHGFGSMLESKMAGDLNEKQTHFLTKIMSGIAQLTLQIDNMQDAGRYDPETGFYEMARSPTDLIDLVHRLVNNSLIPAEKQNLKVSFYADDTLPIVNIDSAMLERSIVNLIDNAIKYTPDGGKIDVYVRHVDDDIIMAVEDNGLGISQENIAKLFDRHYRVQRQEHKRIKGSGLGLFIVRSVARKHNGDAWVESVEGEGSTFFIRIPLSGKNLLGGE